MWKNMIELKQQIQEEYTRDKKRSDRMSNTKLIVFGAAVLGFMLGAVIEPLKIPCDIFAVLAAVWFVILLTVHSRLLEKCETEEKQLQNIEQYAARETEYWKKFTEDGSSFITEENKDLTDLNILGSNSLFQWLNIAYTKSGKRKLMRQLTKTEFDEASWRQMQCAVKEMTGHTAFSVKFQAILSGIRSIREQDFEDRELYPEECKKPEWISIIIGSVLALSMIVSLILSLFEVISFGVAGIVLLVCLCNLCIFSYFHGKEYEEIGKCIHAFGKMERLITFVSEVEFKEDMLCRCQKKIRLGKKTMHRISTIASLYYAKENMFSNILFNVIFVLNPLLVFLYRNTMKEGGAILYETMNSMEKIELIMALAGTAWSKDTVCMPEHKKEISFSAEEMKHPLLPEAECIANDFSCGEEIVIITGSNMSGKSSFMRTIGVNLVLMYAGTYVNAKQFCAPFMRIFTSIGVQDDISRGISTFYGELLRIKKVLDYAGNTEKNDIPFIVFIDEIFKGTNYNDRLFGAKAVVHKLAEKHCITFITTHDFELCEVPEKKVSNYYFTENYNGDQIVFDHKIRFGQCKTTNARYLMERIGVLSPSN